MPFKPNKNTEVNKTSGGGKGRKMSRNMGSTSENDCFCLGTVSHADGFCSKKSDSPTNHSQKPMKTSVVCEKWQNPVLCLINDHTYAKASIKIHQYKFFKTASQSDLGKLKIFSLNVGGLKSKLVVVELQKEILNHDIVCPSEVKMDLCDVGVLKTDFDQFTIFTNIKDEYNYKRRGGDNYFSKKLFVQFNHTVVRK